MFELMKIYSMNLVRKNIPTMWLYFKHFCAKLNKIQQNNSLSPSIPDSQSIQFENFQENTDKSQIYVFLKL